MTFKKATSYTGIAVMTIASIVYFLTVERTGSLWDCGEFILGAHKLQVVHPPGASLFLLVGRMFTWVAQILSDNPSDIAFSINLMSGLCTAAAAMFAGWVSMIMGKIALVGRDGEPSSEENIVLMIAGLVGGLCTAFATSIWFSAVEGEVYAMSTFFTAMTFWAAVKWYNLPNDRESDRWLVFSLFSAGLSVGVHLLSLLALPAIALLYYYKKYDKHTIKGGLLALLIGSLFIAFVQKMVIVGVPSLWKNMEMLMVNSFGLPFHTGLIPTILIIGALAYYLLKYANNKKNHIVQIMTISALLITIASSTIGVVVIRANADTPVNMNAPTDAMRLIPYLNREQYGERPMLKGPTYNAEVVGYDREDRYGRVGDRYEVIDQKLSYKWNERDMILFPRIGHQDRKELHGAWRQYFNDTGAKPSMLYNLKFLFGYQMKWMYWRYFMWNFSGRQNFNQGVFSWEVNDGNWMTGINALDEARLHNMDKLPDTIKNDQSRNKYYLIPVILGIIGLVFQARRSKKEFIALLMLFLLTGLGIIIYSNQPPQEPRERDYVLVGSFMTYAMWIGMSVVGLYSLLKERFKLSGMPAIGVAALALSAPLLMGFQNYDDNDRSSHYGSRDYASNFLNSVDENAIIFTYGDNDTYPLWYAQEVEGIRTDVRVVNLSLIAVDWYINKLRTKVNNSPAIKLTIPEELYRGKNLNQVYLPGAGANRVESLSVYDALKLASTPSTYQKGYSVWPSRNVYIPIDQAKYKASGQIADQNLATNIPFKLGGNNNYIGKDNLAVIDVLASNINDRPIYFSVTCRSQKLLGINDYMQMEGLGLRVIPVKSTSEMNSAYQIFSYGRIDTDKAYTNIMEKWRWGNFDTHDTYIDNSYMAELSAMRMVMLRTSLALANQGDTERAAAVANKFFAAFPNFNFPYDQGVTTFINILINARKYDDAKREIRILAEQSRQYMEFFNSLSPQDLSSFDSDVSTYKQSTTASIALSKQVQDVAFEQEISVLLAPYVAPAQPQLSN